MQTVTASRTLDAPPDAVRAAIGDLEAFMRAGGFSEVEVGDGTIRIARTLGLARIELTLDVIDDPGAVLAYEQRDGIFEEMTTRYTVEGRDGRSAVAATTEFALGGVVGSVLDATIVRRRRRGELNAQFDYLEDVAGGD